LSLDVATVARLTAQGGIVAPTGKPGSVQFNRPHWIAHRDFTPIAAVGDNALRELSKAAA